MLLLAFPLALQAADWSVTALPNAGTRYRGEGKVIPQSYVNRFGGETSPLYRVEVSQAPDPAGYWSLAFWHTGVFGGGEFAEETVPDAAPGSVYQTNKLNVGFTNLFVIRHHRLLRSPVEALFGVSVVRQIFKRKAFVVQGVDGQGLDDVNEISAEGFGFGFAGRHGDRVYLRWQAMAHYYVQIFDAKTDASAGHIYHMEGGIGLKLSPNWSLEAGGLEHYWFILGQGNRRLHIAGTDGAVISWNRQETRTSGGYLRLERRFSGGPPPGPPAVAGLP